LVVDFCSEDGDIAALGDGIRSKKVFDTDMYGTYAVRLSCHVERPSFELAKIFEEDGNESSDVFGRLFCRTLRPCGNDTFRERERENTTVSPCSAYENPTPIGWSTKKMFALEFQDSGWN
jgi:hypothetical protein